VERRYSFLEDKKIDWQTAKAKYKTQIRDSMSREELLETLTGLLGELKDGHVNILTEWDYGRYWDWYLDYPVNHYSNVVERNYLGKKHWQSGPFLNTIIDSIGYVYYGSFAAPISKKALNAVMNRMKNCKGLIFDVRSNGGGKLNNVRLLAERFADTTRTGLTFYFKKGPKPGDFDGPFDYVVKPAGDYQFTKPVVILMNRKSYSAATFWPALMSCFPHVTLMGDHSGGGGGIPYHLELPNGWEFRVSTTRTIDTKNRNIEFGIPPDFEVSMTAEDAARGADPIIERALLFIKGKTAKSQ
jgi:C-terminal processing protease CtpA/Prc